MLEAIVKLPVIKVLAAAAEIKLPVKTARNDISRDLTSARYNGYYKTTLLITLCRLHSLNSTDIDTSTFHSVLIPVIVDLHPYCLV